MYAKQREATVERVCSKVSRSIVKALSLLLVTQGLQGSPAHAVYGGVEATGSPYVLTLLNSQTTRTSFCSMALISERVVVTAAHCMIADQSESLEPRFPIDQLYVSQPGANVTVDALDSRVKVRRVIVVSTYKNTWKPDLNDKRTQIDDIAFLFLEKPLVAGYVAKIATEQELDAAIAQGQLITHFGYGLQTRSSQTHAPWTTQLPLFHGEPDFLDPRKILMVSEGPAALCPGDSGGPWYVDVSGQLKLAAVTVAASGCRTDPPYNGKALGTRIHPYLEFLNSEWLRFLEEEPALIADAAKRRAALERAQATEQQAIQQATSAGTYYKAPGCHADGVAAVLQELSPSGWADRQAALGLARSDPGCPSTHPATPWTIYATEVGAMLRWRISAPDGSWTVYLSPFVETQRRAPAPTTQPSAAPKQTTIQCIKGKTVKKVTGEVPRCPSGYKRR